MDATAKKLIQLLEGGNLELRMAAIRVLTELGIRTKPVVHLLGRALREEPQALKVLALKALIRLGGREVIHQVIPLLETPGELREHALDVVVGVGEAAVEPLGELYSRADFNTKRAVATAMSRIATARAFDCLFEWLPREPFELQKHLSQGLCEAIDSLPDARQGTVFKKLQAFVASPRTRQDLQALIIGIILLGHFRRPRQIQAARDLLCQYGSKKRPPEVRRYALISLSSTLQSGPVRPVVLSFLEDCMADEDWHNVAQQALQAYKRIEEIQQPRVKKLLKVLNESSHYSVQIHVFERLSQEDRPEVAKAILPFLGDSRFRVREVAEQALSTMNSAIEPLLEILARSEDSDLCHRVQAILREFSAEAKKKFLPWAIKQFVRLFDGNDRRYEFFLDFIRSVDPEPLRTTVYKKVQTIRRSRSRDRWLKVSRYMQVLWDQHLITSEGRYVFAVALVKLNNKDLSPHARQANLGLQVMRSLIYDDTPGLVTRLTTDRDLTPDDLFYLGFHFLEEGDDLRPFARSLLEYVIRAHPKSRVARVAEQKLDLLEKMPVAPASKRSRRGGRKSAVAARSRRSRTRALGAPGGASAAMTASPASVRKPGATSDRGDPSKTSAETPRTGGKPRAPAPVGSGKGDAKAGSARQSRPAEKPGRTGGKTKAGASRKSGTSKGSGSKTRSKAAKKSGTRKRSSAGKKSSTRKKAGSKKKSGKAGSSGSATGRKGTSARKSGTTKKRGSGGKSRTGAKGKSSRSGRDRKSPKAARSSGRRKSSR